MPRYDYHCATNDKTVEAVHSIHERLETWGELCALLGISPGETPLEAPIKKLISKCSINLPMSNSQLKSMGFTKLVRREKGVYENVTATEKEKRFMVSDNPASIPDFKGRISD